MQCYHQSSNLELTTQATLFLGNLMRASNKYRFEILKVTFSLGREDCLNADAEGGISIKGHTIKFYIKSFEHYYIVTSGVDWPQHIRGKISEDLNEAMDSFLQESLKQFEKINSWYGKSLEVLKAVGEFGED